TLSKNFYIKGYLNIGAPKTGDIYLYNSNEPITWTAIGSPTGGQFDLVNIYYTTNTGASWAEIDTTYANVSGTNLYNEPTKWLVPDESSINCQIRVQTTDWENVVADSGISAGITGQT
ncbi:unnamed protein product, partial [marine sediment metagenome]